MTSHFPDPVRVFLSVRTFPRLQNEPPSSLGCYLACVLFWVPSRDVEVTVTCPALPLTGRVPGSGYTRSLCN